MLSCRRSGSYVQPPIGITLRVWLAEGGCCSLRAQCSVKKSVWRSGSTVFGGIAEIGSPLKPATSWNQGPEGVAGGSAGCSSDCSSPDALSTSSLSSRSCNSPAEVSSLRSCWSPPGIRSSSSLASGEHCVTSSGIGTTSPSAFTSSMAPSSSWKALISLKSPWGVSSG